MPRADSVGTRQRRALTLASLALLAGCVALIFVLFVIPGAVFGYSARTVRSQRDIIASMAKAMSGIGYYIVMAFFAAQFIAAFIQSNLGALLAIKGADARREAALPLQITLIGIVMLTASINLLVGSASAKWALIVVFCRGDVKSTGIGTVVAHLRPHSVTLRVAWSA